MKMGIDLFERDLYRYGDSFTVSGKIRTVSKSSYIRVPNRVPYGTNLGLLFDSMTPEESIEEKYDSESNTTFKISPTSYIEIIYQANAVPQQMDSFYMDTSLLTADIIAKTDEIIGRIQNPKRKFNRIFRFVSSLHYDNGRAKRVANLYNETGDEKVFGQDFVPLESLPAKIPDIVSICFKPGVTVKMWEQVNGPYYIVQYFGLPFPFAQQYVNESRLVKYGNGVCQDFAHLLLTMDNYTGIPTKDVAGFAQVNGSNIEFGHHAWNEVLLDGRWTPVDPTWKLIGNVPHYMQKPEIDLPIGMGQNPNKMRKTYITLRHQ